MDNNNFYIYKFMFNLVVFDSNPKPGLELIKKQLLNRLDVCKQQAQIVNGESS